MFLSYTPLNDNLRYYALPPAFMRGVALPRAKPGGENNPLSQKSKIFDSSPLKVGAKGVVPYLDR